MTAIYLFLILCFLLFSDDVKSKKKLETCCEENVSQKEATPPNKKKPWLTLVSYVDDLTVGGRRDSQGNYVDGVGSFPSFGNNKPVKVPQDCFPRQCVQRYEFSTLKVRVLYF